MRHRAPRAPPAAGWSENQRCISGAWAETRKNTGPIVTANSAGTHSTSQPGAGGGKRASETGSITAARTSSDRWIVAARRIGI